MLKLCAKSILGLVIGTFLLIAGGKEDLPPLTASVEPIPPMSTPVPVYVGLGLVWGKYSGQCGNRPDCPYEDVTYGALLRAGYEWNRYIGLEARVLGTFLQADPLGGEELRHIGLYLKPMYPFKDRFNIYALLGYGWTKTETKSPYLQTVDEKGFSAGLGIEYDLSNSSKDFDRDTRYDRKFDGYADQERGWGVFLDYQRLLLDPEALGNPDLDVVSAGITYDF